MRKGKAVYLEKPMVQRFEDGLELVRAQAETKAICQVGSQRVSSTVCNKARELYQAGAIGQLVLAEAFWDRQSALGAWQYSIPRDASPETVDWQRFLGDTPALAFDPVRFFRWRNYRAYGTGVAGDLFVHLFSGLHLITGSMGPTRIYASGGLRYWQDGRDAPDVMLGIYDYPESREHAAFNLQVRVNLIDGGGGGDAMVLVGTEGKIILRDGGLRVTRSVLAQAPGYGGWDSFDTFDSAGQAAYAEWYQSEYRGKSDKSEKAVDEYSAEPGYSDHHHHHQNFIAALRGKGSVIEDPSFGFRAAAIALASNQSLFEGKVVHWKPEAMTLA
jgi:predicted dehydrogenase